MLIHRMVYATLLASCFTCLSISPALAECDSDCNCEPCFRIDNCTVIGSSPTTLTLSWDWGTPPPDYCIIAAKRNGTYEGYTDRTEVPYNNTSSCTAVVEDLIENTLYDLRIIPYTNPNGNAGSPCFSQGQTASNYVLRPSAHVGNPTWFPYLASGIDEVNLDLSDYIQANAAAGELKWIWFDLGNHQGSWDIKKVVVYVVCQKKGTIGGAEVNIEINGQQATSQAIPMAQIPSPNMNPNWKEFEITFTNNTGKWTASEIDGLKIGFRAGDFPQDDRFFRVFQAYVKTYEN